MSTWMILRVDLDGVPAIRSLCRIDPYLQRDRLLALLAGERGVPLIHDEITWPRRVAVVQAASACIVMLGKPAHDRPATLRGDGAQLLEQGIRRAAATRFRGDEHVIGKPHVASAQG